MTTPGRNLRTFVYLASASPRRRELLAQIGIDVTLLPVTVDESPQAGEKPGDLVRRLAADKVRAGMACRPDPPAPIVAADTVVALGSEIFGKPRDEADATRILSRLAGHTHQVWTAVAVADAAREQIEVQRSAVTLRAMTPEEIAAYWRSGEPRDKAGAYGIQGLGAVFISQLEGSYSGVMGLPLYETARLLESFGCPVQRV